MWGYRGDWEVRQPMTFIIDQKGFYAYRRILSNLRMSKARERVRVSLRTTSELESSIRTGIDLKDPEKPLSASLVRDYGKLVSIRKSNKILLLAFSRSRSGLKNNDSDTSHFQGTSDWIDQDNAIKVVMFLRSLGHRIHQN
jgi:hypothetical protein